MPNLKWRKADASTPLAHFTDIENHPLIYGRIHTAHQRYDYSLTNQLIHNLKKKPDRPATELHYKAQAIKKFAEEIIQFLEKQNKDDHPYLLVPIPPSKTKDNPLYDDRVDQVAKKVATAIDWITFCPVVERIEDAPAMHESSSPRSADEIFENLRFVTLPCGSPSPTRIIILDDVLTSGASFDAVRMLLEQNLNSPKIIGLFWAKSIDDFDLTSLLDEIS